MAVGKILSTPIKGSKSVVEMIINQLTEAIISGELKPGEKIPTEMEMTQLFNVGRNAVREAINVLSHFGVVEIRRAEGTFISEKFNKRMFDPKLYGLILQNDSGKDILGLREVFDIGIMNVVINTCTEDGLARIKEAYRDLEASLMRPDASPEIVLERDIKFHGAIDSTIQNKLVNEVAGYIDRITIPSRIETMRLLLENRQQQSFLELHLNIVNMIEGRKSESIVAVINDHYRYWRQIGSMNKDFENDIQKEK